MPMGDRLHWISTRLEHQAADGQSGGGPGEFEGGLVDGAVLHGTAAGLAGVLGEGAALDPGDDLVLTIRAGHVAGGLEGDKAFVPRAGRTAGRLEGDGAAFVARHRTGGGGGRSLTGGQSDGDKAEEQGADEFGFHVVFGLEWIWDG